MDKKIYSIGLKFALKGIVSFFRKGRNAKIHLVAAIVVLSAGFYFDLKPEEWLWIALSIALVFITEMINSSIEILCDLVMPEQNENAGRLKDIGAGAVLIAAIFSLVVAAIIFWPKIIQLILEYDF